MFPAAQQWWEPGRGGGIPAGTAPRARGSGQRPCWYSHRRTDCREHHGPAGSSLPAGSLQIRTLVCPGAPEA